eukprot:COSAG06_NODE_238_length_19422_cov_16.417741_29_plen_77_part_00
MQAKTLGLTRAIGVSSFSIAQLQGLLAMDKAETPAVNQCQVIRFLVVLNSANLLSPTMTGSGLQRKIRLEPSILSQ